jgi:nucleoside-diphosphate-sugar epimerase
MRILLVGGSGYVGSMVTPYLKEQHSLRIFDLVPPKDPSLEYVQGSVSDAAAIRAALDGIEGVVYMAMGRNSDGRYEVRDVGVNHDLHVTGLHRVLVLASEAKIARAVYTSSGSVHGTRPGGRVPSEDTPCDAPDVYGFTKWLGELVCEHFVRVRKMAIVSLRLNMPMPLEDWQKSCRPGRPATQTAAPDVASAISLGLTAPVTGFHTLSIAGDYEGKMVNCARAKQVLGWEPRERPTQLAQKSSPANEQ